MCIALTEQKVLKNYTETSLIVIQSRFFQNCLKMAHDLIIFQSFHIISLTKGLFSNKNE